MAGEQRARRSTCVGNVLRTHARVCDRDRARVQGLGGRDRGCWCGREGAGYRGVCTERLSWELRSECTIADPAARPLNGAHAPEGANRGFAVKVPLYRRQHRPPLSSHVPTRRQTTTWPLGRLHPRALLDRWCGWVNGARGGCEATWQDLSRDHLVCAVLVPYGIPTQQHHQESKTTSRPAQYGWSRAPNIDR